MEGAQALVGSDAGAAQRHEGIHDFFEVRPLADKIDVLAFDQACHADSLVLVRRHPDDSGPARG
ncbi:hypothetical protein GCM10009670_02960 [Citricoccus alkalitolerans]